MRQFFALGLVLTFFSYSWGQAAICTGLPQAGQNETGDDPELKRLIDSLAQHCAQHDAAKAPLPLEQIRECVDKNEVVLLFVLNSKASLLFLIEANAPRERPDAGLAVHELPPAETIAEKVRALTDVETLALPVRARLLAQECFDLLLKPVADRIRGKHLVVIPDGCLEHLPFGLLLESASEKSHGHYLVQEHRVRYAPTLTALHMSRKRHVNRQPLKRSLWAVSDPVYTASDERYEKKVAKQEPDKQYPRARFAGIAVQEISQLMGASRASAITGLKATLGAVESAAERGDLAVHRYLVFAAHGVSPGFGNPAGLVLCPMGDDSRKDHVLDVGKVSGLRLKADLVILISCYGGHALGNAFLRAGSRGVFCAIGPITDSRESADLEVAFFRNLLAGQPAADALREAQLGMIRDGKAPLYWAPFILIGE